MSVDPLSPDDPRTEILYLPDHAEPWHIAPCSRTIASYPGVCERAIRREFVKPEKKERTDTERLNWIDAMRIECEGRLLTRLFIPDGKPFRDKIDAVMDEQDLAPSE